uniref:non-specific serine/threonine protein kinase n=1 Tax=Fagus sylvatica TaxID=28930 RepID=A0A2N9ICB0_FAGSY
MSIDEESDTQFKLYIKVQKVQKENVDEAEENYLDHVPGMPTRYSYDDLQAMTENFSKELGAGGFGTVFEGTLFDGTKVAVKRLDGFRQIKKSFLAEVETIGNIHHFNLVRLIGFCAEKSHRLLVYEYMSNGSLDRWVFDKNPETLLDWQHRKKIILDIARGLTYLHEDCRQKIVHLDIKPQNILLDETFNAKFSDFGLSKLVDRDQSQVVMTMRGTPGYMALEWLSSVITEKVDVYSFGIMLLEILCGRRNFDRSQSEEAMHLLNLFKKNMEEDQLLDLVDNYSEDMQLHGAEVVNVMRAAARCLQNNYTKRPFHVLGAFGTVMSQFINKKFRDGVSLLQKFNQEQQMMFLLISACSTQRKGKETYWCTCCPIKAQFGLSARHVHWAVKGHLGLFIASVGSVRFRSSPLRPGSALFNLSRSDLFQLRQALLGFSPICSVPVRSAPLQSESAPPRPRSTPSQSDLLFLA